MQNSTMRQSYFVVVGLFMTTQVVADCNCNNLGVNDLWIEYQKCDSPDV